MKFACVELIWNLRIQINTGIKLPYPILLVGRSKASVYGRSLAEVEGSNSAGDMYVCLLKCWVLSGRGLCDGPISSPGKSYRPWCVIVCMCVCVICKPQERGGLCSSWVVAPGDRIRKKNKITVAKKN